MRARARRLLLRLLHAPARRAVPVLRLWRAVLGASVVLGLQAGFGWATAAERIVAARFAEPTSRYQHGVFGDSLEWGALVLTLGACAGCTPSSAHEVTIRLPKTRVFEDNAPRLFAGNDGHPLVMVVETDLSRGARLSVYDARGLVAATPFIGRPQRWLAPIGAADLDGDGRVELAYIDRPHLAKTLRIWRLEPSGLREVASAGGLTNHQFGWDFIAGGLRDCANGPEIIVASADWQHVVAVRFTGGGLQKRIVAQHASPAALGAALTCP